MSACFSKVKTIIERGETEAIVRLYAKDSVANQTAELKKRMPL